MEGDLNIDEIEDSMLDDLHMFSGASSVGENKETTQEQQALRRAAQRTFLKAQQKEGTKNRVLNTIVKYKRGCSAVAKASGAN